MGFSRHRYFVLQGTIIAYYKSDPFKGNEVTPIARVQLTSWSSVAMQSSTRYVVGSVDEGVARVDGFAMSACMHCFRPWLRQRGRLVIFVVHGL